MMSPYCDLEYNSLFTHSSSWRSTAILCLAIKLRAFWGHVVCKILFWAQFSKYPIHSNFAAFQHFTPPPPPPPHEPVPTDLLLALIKVQFVKFSFKKSPATFPKSTLCQRPICVLTHFNYLNIIWIMYAHVCDEAGTSSAVCICSVNVFLCTLTVVPQFQHASVEC